MFIRRSFTSLSLLILFAGFPALVFAAPSSPDSEAGSAGETAITYGYSVKHRPLVAYVLGTGANTTFILGGMHGNELSPPPVVQFLRQYLKDHPEELAGCRVVLVPNVNPDGDAAHTRANAHGVDLNRNFPYGWRTRRRGVRLSTGSGPLSEPESRALVQLLDRFRLAKVVDIHQPLNTLVGVGPAGRRLAMAMKPQNHYRFTTNVGYPTPGSFGSYLAHMRHIACVTLELPRIGPEAAWSANKRALLVAIHFAPAAAGANAW